MDYKYASIASLREYGLNTIQYPDDLLKRLVRLYSDRVNRILGREFIAAPKTKRVNPFSSLFKIPGSSIVKVDSITVNYTDGSSALLEPSYYEVKENNLIQLKNLTIEGIDALDIGLITGDMEYNKVVEVELATAISSYEVSAQLVDVSQLEPRDVLVFGNTTIIINSVDYDSKIIEFDDVGNIRPIPIGTKTTCYGQVPVQIEEAIKLFIKHHKKLQGFSGRITSERIGKSYSYETTGLEASITGIAEIDSILFLFINDDFDIVFL